MRRKMDPRLCLPTSIKSALRPPTSASVKGGNVRNRSFDIYLGKGALSGVGSDGARGAIHHSLNSKESHQHRQPRFVSGHSLSIRAETKNSAPRKWQENKSALVRLARSSSLSSSSWSRFASIIRTGELAYKDIMRLCSYIS